MIGKVVLRGLMISFVGVVLTGCASVMPMRSAKKVIISDKPVSAMCWYKGQVSVNGGSAEVTSLYKRAKYEEKIYNKLRIQAYDLGANRVVLKVMPTKAQLSQARPHQYAGNAYWCPSR